MILRQPKSRKVWLSLPSWIFLAMAGAFLWCLGCLIVLPAHASLAPYPSALTNKLTVACRVVRSPFPPYQSPQFQYLEKSNWIYVCYTTIGLTNKWQYFEHTAPFDRLYIFGLNPNISGPIAAFEIWELPPLLLVPEPLPPTATFRSSTFIHD